MKRIFSIFFMVLLTAGLYGCASKISNQSANTSDTGNTSPAASSSGQAAPMLKIREYFPMTSDTRYSYAGNGNEYASYTVYNDYTAEGKVQQRVNNGGTETARVIELKDGRLSIILSREEAYYRENLLERSSGENPEILLMEPLAEGTSWELDNGGRRSITSVSADLTLPMGTYKAIEVTTEGKDGKTVDYYVKNMGLVKSVFKSGDTEVSSALDSIEQNALLKQKINFYYPKAGSDKIYFVTKEISFRTNDITKQVLTSAYGEIAEQHTGKTFNTGIKVNSMYVNTDNMVYIDLNSVFLKEMNSQTAANEKLILRSLANTIGKYYNTEKIILTIDNNLYKSKHTSFKKGEYIKADYKNTAEESQAKK